MQAIELLGVPGSPYTRKMLALLRYRRIAYRMLWGGHFDQRNDYPSPKVKLLPTFYFPSAHGKEAVVDSTPIIQRLELQYAPRSVAPDDPVLGFVNLLVEDFADEWLTKAMFHYRWHYAQDAQHAAPLLMYSQHPQMSSAQAKAQGDAFAQRQISRLPLVGSSHETAPIIESSYQRVVAIMDGIIERQGFVLGSRPSAADFAIYGQLTQLGLIDPTPAHLLEQQSPRLRAWLDLMEDLSGHENAQWLDRAQLSHHVLDLLQEIGRVYAPFLVANAQAAHQGLTSFEVRLDGKTWSQAVFPYQVKCLETLRQARAALSRTDCHDLDELLTGTGCEAMF
jgi:glutathione S-transferase